ncbi:TPA: DUF551 domain-containing protein [Escherichia coli]
MSTTTKEQLIERLQHIISVASGFPESEKAQIDLELARIALASLEAEPVAYIFKHPAGKLFWALTDESNKEQADVIPVYAAHPVPVVPAALPENDDEDGHDIDYLEPSEVYSLGRTAGWNACRAAMLHGAEPVSQTCKLPVNTPCQDAPAHIWLQTAGVWPEDGELSELTWCSHNQHHDDTLYVRADLVNGNSPVTPDGWISCSERMPKGYADVLVTDGEHVEVKWWDESGYWNSWAELNSDILAHEITHWMPLPEPPQEAK